MTEPDWTLLTLRINETWAATRGHGERFDRIDQRMDQLQHRLDRIENQMTLVIRLTQAREAEHGAVKAVTDAFADLRGLVLELGRRVDELERRQS